MVHVLGGNETGLVAYWNMNEGTGNEIMDLTVNNNNGIINGGFFAEGVEFNSLTDVRKENEVQPGKFQLYQNYPNPFNPTTKIKYSVPSAERLASISLQIKVYDVLGNDIATLINEKKSPGIYEVEFDATGFSSGVYFYTLSTQFHSQTKKMLIIK
jgi:hypothetical protein